MRGAFKTTANLHIEVISSPPITINSCQAAGVPLNVAKELMGHSDISVTAKIYTHMVDEVFEQNRKRLAEYANQKEQKAVNI